MTLRGNLLLLVAGTVVPLIALALVLGFVLVEHEKETTRNGAIARTRAVMTAVDREIQGHVLSLNGLATSRALERGDLRAFAEEMKRFLPSQAGFAYHLVKPVDLEDLMKLIRRVEARHGKARRSQNAPGS